MIDVQKLYDDIVKKINALLNDAVKSGIIAQTLTKTIKNHVSKKYPNSKHWSLSKINPLNKDTCSINVPGATRAYHDVYIFPRVASALTIPINNAAKGHRAREFDLYMFMSKRGNALLADKSSGMLMYVLKYSVFQPQDNSLMPSDETLAIDVENGVMDKAF